MDKIQILKKMIEWFEISKKHNLETGFCYAYFHFIRGTAIEAGKLEKTMLADIPELKAYQPKNYWNDHVYWFDPSDHDHRINICKEIIENLKLKSK